MIAPPVNDETIPPATSSARVSPPKRSMKLACEIEDAMIPESIEGHVSDHLVMSERLEEVDHLSVHYTVTG